MLLHSGVVGRRSGTVAHVDLLVGRSRGRSTTIDGVLLLGLWLLMLGMLGGMLVLLLLMMMLKLLCMLRRMVRRRLHLLLQL